MKKKGMAAVFVVLAFASSVWLSAMAAEDATESKQDVRKCYKCRGKGTVVVNTKDKCDNCDGTGVLVSDVVLKNKRWGDEVNSYWHSVETKRSKSKRSCPKCNRSGKMNVKKEIECSACKGAGYLTKGGRPYFKENGCEQNTSCDEELRSDGETAQSTVVVQSLADQIRANNVQIGGSSLKIAGDRGWSEFDYSANHGVFTIQGKGTEFATMWSKCRSGSVFAHKDNVDMIGRRSGLRELPADCSEFPSYCWNYKKIAVKEGDVVVFMNKEGRFLAAKVVKVKNIDDGESSNSLHIEFKIY